MGSVCRLLLNLLIKGHKFPGNLDANSKINVICHPGILIAEVYLHFLSKPTLTYDLSFRLLMFVCLLAWTHKINFKLFFQSSQLMIVRIKNGQAIK